MCYCPADEASCEFQAMTYPKGRVERACEECRCRLLPGVRYARMVQKWEGEIVVSCFCLGCDTWASALHAAQRAACGCSGWELGRMWDEVEEFAREHLGYDPSTGKSVGHGKVDPKLVGIAMLLDERLMRLAVLQAEV